MMQPKEYWIVNINGHNTNALNADGKMRLIFFTEPAAIYQYHLATEQFPAYCRVIIWHNEYSHSLPVYSYWLENKLKLDIDNDKDFDKYMKLKAFW